MHLQTLDVDTGTRECTLTNMHLGAHEQYRVGTQVCMATNTCPYKNIPEGTMEDLQVVADNIAHVKLCWACAS